MRRLRVPLAAIDGTGLESRHVSRYFTKRQADGNPSGDRTYAHFPKVVFVVDCGSHMILSAVPGRGPATDLVQFGRAFSQAVRRARIDTLLADAHFDAERVHKAVRSHGVRTIIPPTRGRPTDKPPTGRWRRVMKQRFARLKRNYGQRWQIETVNSMIKRRLGSALRARVEANQFREIILRAITHNVMIIRMQVFYRAIGSSFRVHNQMGYGFLESVYEKCLCIELRNQGLIVETQQPINVYYENQEVGHFVADLLIENTVIVELKSVRSLNPSHEVQLVNYLTATGIPIGLLINFAEKKVEVIRKVRVLPDRIENSSNDPEP